MIIVQFVFNHRLKSFEDSSLFSGAVHWQGELETPKVQVWANTLRIIVKANMNDKHSILIDPVK